MADTDREGANAPRRVFVVRASLYWDGAPAGESAAEALRVEHRELLERAGWELRASMGIEITSGLHVGAVEPTDPAEVECHVVPDPRVLADIRRRLNQGPLAAPLFTWDECMQLLADVERWRVRCSARLATPEGDRVFREACDELLGGALNIVRDDRRNRG